ncbi:MAG: cytochrome c biogenesis protein CcsA, partial [Rhodospirillales bacterium]|nr:cytochrome c biogenesis protein CcsA [Rhodospirillales bacterium]
WDPVENASFMPWLAGTALLHSVAVVEKRDALKTWTVLLAIVAFSLSLMGTFLVRSGVLTSVHAFATDPARGVFILGFLVVVVGGSLALFAVRAPNLKGGGVFAPVSREGFLVLNNLLLATAAGTVLLGTLYPLFLDALTGEKVSVGPPFFEGTFVPLMVPVVILMGVGPLLKWKRSDLAGAIMRLKAAVLAAATVAATVLYLTDGRAALAVLGMALGAWLFVASLTILAERAKLFEVTVAESLRRLRRIPPSAWGAVIAHMGVAVMVFGVTASETWQTEKLQVMRPGETVTVGGYQFTFRGAEAVTGPNYTAQRGHFDVTRGSEPFVHLAPEQRRYPVPPMTTTEAAIYPMIRGDLYAVVGDEDGAGGWATRLYFKPLVSWIWGGALIMMAGGLLSLADRRHRVGAPTRSRPRGVKSPAAQGAQL